MEPLNVRCPNERLPSGSSMRAESALLIYSIVAFVQMSYNNYLDGDAAYSAVSDIPEPACVVVKHTNPCGAATQDDLLEAYRLAVRADPISAFGGIVAFNRCSVSLTTPAQGEQSCGACPHDNVALSAPDLEMPWWNKPLQLLHCCMWSLERCKHCKMQDMLDQFLSGLA